MTHRRPIPPAPRRPHRSGWTGWLAVSAGLFAVPVIGTAPAGATAPVRAALPPRHINHIIVVDLENESYPTTFGPGSPATYLNGVLRKKGELLTNYYGTGHDSLDNYITQVSGQAPTKDTQADCSANGFTYAAVEPGTPAPTDPAAPGQVVGDGCVYPAGVKTIASQLDQKYPPNPKTHVAGWREYAQDMGNVASRDGGVPDPTGGTDCAHPALGATDMAEAATPADQYANRHNPFVWFHSVIDNTAECDANVVPLGTLAAGGKPAPGGHLARDLAEASTTPHFAFITPNLCNDGHDATCAGTNSTGGHTGGLAGADLFLSHWMPLILGSPAYKEGDTLVVVTFDEAAVDPSNPAYAAACCHEPTGPDTASPGNAAATTDQFPGGGRVGALLLSTRWITPGSTDNVPYNHASALRSYEDLLGLTSGGSDGQGHLGEAGAQGLRPFGPDVFHSH
ncbi:MAG TPA: alkaline phosphatase family protein [Acidimicrobiales bacterium]|nr:alkaline phosphatase family protein [Acidimicrobiales bacterium]